MHEEHRYERGSEPPKLLPAPTRDEPDNEEHEGDSR